MRAGSLLIWAAVGGRVEADSGVKAWTTPKYEYYPYLAASMLTLANHIVQLNYAELDLPMSQRDLFITSREIGYCPSVHLDMYFFGNTGGGLGSNIMNTLSYLVIPEVRTLRLTGYWYSAAPMNTATLIGDGYCPAYIEGWTPDHRYPSAEARALLAYGAASDGTYNGLTNTISDWYMVLTNSGFEDPPPLRLTGVDGSPVQRLVVLQDGSLPRFREETEMNLCPDTYCLRHQNLTYTSVVAEHPDDGSPCRKIVSASSELRGLEDDLNAHVCEAVRSYKNLLHNGLGASSVSKEEVLPSLYQVSPKLKEKLKSSIKLAEQVIKGQPGEVTSFLEDVEEALAILAESGYHVAAGEGSNHCPNPHPASKADVQEVLDYIKPDYVCYIYTNPYDIEDAEPEWIESMNNFFSLFDGLVPVERRYLASDETAILEMVDSLPTIPCGRDSPDPNPTLSPDDGPSCKISGKSYPLPETDVAQNRFQKACTRFRWHVIYKTVIAGAASGAVMGSALYHVLSENPADLDDNLDLAAPCQEDNEEAVLFAH